MLLSLNILNIALITRCSLTLDKGLNILSGETGAGKSIIIDSLTFVLGDRADKTLIRSGENMATVEAVFTVELNDKYIEVLNDLDIEIEDTLIIKRTMTIEGRNECRVNGKIVTLGMLRKLTVLLADIYGQHEHQSLINVANHIDLLDSYGNLFPIRDKIKDKYDELQNIKSQLSRFGSEAEIKRKLDTLQYQIDEIINAKVEEGEEENLVNLRTKYMSAEKIIQSVSGAYNTLNSESYSSDNACSAALSFLNSVSQYDDKLKELSDRLDVVSIELSDIVSSLNDYVNEFDYDERKADYVEKRIDEIRLLKRKYGNDLNAFLSEAQKEYDTLINSNDIIDSLNKQYKDIEEVLLDIAEQLSLARGKYAMNFEKEIISELNDLGMKGTTFSVQINSNPSDISPIGYDSVEFLISPNIGEPLKPLSKIISGGEMSRFMLAIKNITARLDNIECMVFDEIDSGISGHIAQVVGEKLCNISRNRQVIAITHLPQLASMADNHFLIKKEVDKDKTLTKLSLLNEEDSLREVARLIGGSDYSGYAMPHANEMILHGKNYKNSLNS